MTALAAYVPAVPVDQLISNDQPRPAGDHIDYPYKALGTPNDALYSSQQSYLNSLAAPAAWDVTTGSATPVIAVIDTGFGLNHDDLANRWYINANEDGATANEGGAPNCTSRGLVLNKRCNNLDDDNNGYKDDWRGWDFVQNDNDPSAGSIAPTASAAYHGTYVAGIAAGSGNNGVGIAGISWGARIMPVQVLPDSGNGFTTQVANGIKYAVDNGATVINLSLGSVYPDDYLRSEIDYAIAHNVTVVVAAGNDGCDCIAYPGNYPEVVTVGSIDHSDHRSSFSSYGANLDLVATGSGGICSALWSAASPTSSYSCGGSGTSFSTPLVTGTVALMQSRDAGLTPTAIEGYLRAAAAKLPDMAGVNRTDALGWGRLNLYQSLMQAAQPVTTAAGALPIAGFNLGALSLGQGPEVVTICHSSGATCNLLLTDPSGQTRLLGSQAVDRYGNARYYWSPAALGNVTGQWTLQTYNDATHSVDGAAAIVLTVSP